MRKLYFLFPELNIQQGGHTAQMAFLEISKRFCSAEAVTYMQQTADVKYLDDVLKQDHNDLLECIFVIHWGPHVPKLLKRLKGLSVVYVAHSTGWGFDLPPCVPVLAVSRHTQSYWATRAPKNPVFYLPNVITDQFYNSDEDREIDVLVMKRKTSSYVLNELLPLLKSRCRIKLIDGWVDDLADEMRNSKIFLYDSSEHWLKQRVSEGFGLPPLEAMACGCQVFSSLNHALSDYLEPNVNCYQIGVYSTHHDLNRIMTILDQWTPKYTTDNVVSDYRSEKVATRMHVILSAVNEFFTMTRGLSGRSSSPGFNLASRLEILSALFT